jgi:plastocyanin
VRRGASVLTAFGLVLAAGAAAAPAALAQDVTPPGTTAALDPADPGPGGTYDGPVEVTLSAADPDEGDPDPVTHTVTAEGFAWDTQEVDATVGDTVQWDFANGGHDICIDDSPPEWAATFGDCGDDEVLGDFREGDTGGSKTFAQVGSFGYYCSLHEPSMRGFVNVAEGGGGTPGSGVDITEYRVNTDGATGEWQISENTGSADPFETAFTIADEGNHVVEYRSTDVAGNVEEIGSVPFAIEAAAGPPDITLGVKPRRKQVKVNRPAAFTAQLSNAGGPAAEVQVCVKARSRLVKVTGGRCWWLDELGTGQRTAKFTFKPKRAARGKRVKIQFRLTQLNGPGESTTATLKVARR